MHSCPSVFQEPQSRHAQAGCFKGCCSARDFACRCLPFAAALDGYLLLTTSERL